MNVLQSLLMAMEVVRGQVVALGQALARCGATSSHWYWGAVASWVIGALWLVVKVGWMVIPPHLRCACSPADM